MRTQFLGKNIWSQLDRLAAVANKTLAVAYVSNIGKSHFSKGDTIITNATPEAIRSGQTSATLLRDVAIAGANVYSLPILHAKILLTNRAVIVGSANISKSSRNLKEAGIITSDPKILLDSRRYVESLKRQAKRLSIPDLSLLAKIPVNRKFAQGTKAGNPKPSLLEAIQSNSYLLNDVALFWYCLGPQLPTKVIQEHARRRRIPLPSADRWEWYESPFSMKALRSAKRQLLDRPLVAWEADMNEDKTAPIRFKSHCNIAVNCIDVFKLKNRLIQIVGKTSVRTPLDLRSGRRDLARFLTLGLKKDRKVAAAIASDPVGIITTRQLRRIYKLGTTP